MRLSGSLGICLMKWLVRRDRPFRYIEVILLWSLFVDLCYFIFFTVVCGSDIISSLSFFVSSIDTI